MVEYTLNARHPLGGFTHTYGPVALREVTGMGVVSLAVPLGGDKAFATTLKKQYNLTRPAVGTSTVAPSKTLGEMRLLGLGADQLFLLCAEGVAHEGYGHIKQALGAVAYLTEQSDGWALLRLSGPLCRDVLARLCMLDLDDAAFPVHAAARTVMEHLGVILVREKDNTYLLLSARSSAGSFLHALETSVRYVMG